MSVIAFVGSVFSPWYRWSGRRDPENHVCINVATYGPGGRFTMTDRGRAALRRDATAFTVGPSSLRWTGGALEVEVEEWGAPPLVTPVRGRITLVPEAVVSPAQAHALTPDGAHMWQPIAPAARIRVELTQGQAWEGHGYFDANWGSRALEADFDRWTWGRYARGRGAVCFYDAVRRDGSALALGLEIDAQGRATPVEPPPPAALPRTPWAIARATRGDAGSRPRQVLAMLDAPFYSRAAVETTLWGERLTGVHEVLDARRFRGPWLMPMIALRVPRRAGWRFKD